MPTTFGHFGICETSGLAKSFPPLSFMSNCGTAYDHKINQREFLFLPLFCFRCLTGQSLSCHGGLFCRQKQMCFSATNSKKVRSEKWQFDVVSGLPLIWQYSTPGTAAESHEGLCRGGRGSHNKDSCSLARCAACFSPTNNKSCVSNGPKHWSKKIKTNDFKMVVGCFYYLLPWEVLVTFEDMWIICEPFISG